MFSVACAKALNHNVTLRLEIVVVGFVNVVWRGTKSGSQGCSGSHWLQSMSDGVDLCWRC